MAPMKRNRNQDRKNTSVRRRGEKSKGEASKYYDSSDDSRIRKRITGHKLANNGRPNKNAKSRNMGVGRHSKIAKNTSRESTDSNEMRTKNYIRKAVKLGLSSGYLTLDENSDGQVLRVTSDIVNFDPLLKDGSGSDECPSDSATRERDSRKCNCARAGTDKRVATKIRRTNLGKRGRARTKSPKKSIAQKRRRKRSEGRTKVKARIQKRKRMPEVKSDEPRAKKNEDDAGNDDDGDDDDGGGVDDEVEVDEPDMEDNSDKNSNDGKKKSSVAGRPDAIVPDTEKSSSKATKENYGNGEESDEDGTSDEEEEELSDGEEGEQPEGLATNEEPDEEAGEQKADN